MVDYVNNKNNGEFMDASDLEAIETASASKQDKQIGSNNFAIVSGATGELEASATTKTEIGYVSGVTSAIQTQMDAKQDANIGTASRAVQSGAGGALEVSAVTTTELAILAGATPTTTEFNLLSSETNLHPTGTESAQGELELNTSAETVTGTDTTRATHAAGVKAAIDDAAITYAESTFTPTIQDGSFSDGEGQTYSIQEGFYTRIGNTVFFEMYLVALSVGTLTTSGPTYIANLPITASSDTDYSITVGSDNGAAITAGHSITGYVIRGTSRIRLELWDATTGTTELTISEWSANNSIRIAGHYKV